MFLTSKPAQKSLTGLTNPFLRNDSQLKAVATYSKLMSKPGSGKTTFLQHIAMQCNQGELLPERIPIFIRLKNFAGMPEVGRFSLLNYIH